MTKHELINYLSELKRDFINPDTLKVMNLKNGAQVYRLAELIEAIEEFQRTLSD